MKVPFKTLRPFSFIVEIRNSSGETPCDVAKRFAQLACVKLLGGDDGEDSDGSESTRFSDDEDAPLMGLAGDSSDSPGLQVSVKSKKASRGSVFCSFRLLICFTIALAALDPWRNQISLYHIISLDQLKCPCLPAGLDDILCICRSGAEKSGKSGTFAQNRQRQLPAAGRGTSRRQTKDKGGKGERQVRYV